jgi:uncharacterized protein YpuA (DUF1002 family)
MNKEELKSYFEKLAEDAGLEPTARQINKFVNLAIELKEEAEITLEELIEEFSNSWSEFVEEIATYMFGIIEEEQEDMEDGIEE